MDFARTRVPQITATAALVTYALTRRKLTPGGIVAGVAVATIHMLHPWPAFFWLLIVFFVCGTAVTKIGHARKAHLTLSSTGGSGGEGARTSAQVGANSGFASLLILLHAWMLRTNSPFTSSHLPTAPGPHFPVLEALLPLGIVAQYAAVAADTFSSELGILSTAEPLLITAPWRRVPRGTNGGVTPAGLAWGAVGSAVLTGVAGAALAASEPHVTLRASVALTAALAGFAGTLLDSLLGALVQATVADGASGKVVEGPGGSRVRVVAGGSRRSVGGVDWLSNNGVNFVMAAGSAVLAMAAAWAIEVPGVQA